MLFTIIGYASILKFSDKTSSSIREYMSSTAECIFYMYCDIQLLIITIMIKVNYHDQRLITTIAQL